MKKRECELLQTIFIQDNKKEQIDSVDDVFEFDCEENEIPYIQKGKRFYGLGKHTGCWSVDRYIMEESGPVIECSTSLQKVDYEVVTQQCDRIYSEVVDFNTESVTVLLHFDDHDSKRIFKGAVYKHFVNNALLKRGQKFYFNTKNTSNGFNIEFEPILDDYNDKEIIEFLDMYNLGKN